MRERAQKEIEQGEMRGGRSEFERREMAGIIAYAASDVSTRDGTGPRSRLGSAWWCGSARHSGAYPRVWSPRAFFWNATRGCSPITSAGPRTAFRRRDPDRPQQSDARQIAWLSKAAGLLFAAPNLLRSCGCTGWEEGLSAVGSRPGTVRSVAAGGVSRGGARVCESRCAVLPQPDAHGPGGHRARGSLRFVKLKAQTTRWV